MTLCIHGLAVVRGVAVGRAVVVSSGATDAPRYHIDPSQVAQELARMGGARDAVVRELQGLLAGMPADAPSEISALIDVHLQLLLDETLEAAVRGWIVEHHYNAEWALTVQTEAFGRQFDAMDDPYLRERKADLEQVVDRVLHHLKASAGGQAAAMPERPEWQPRENAPRILVARDLSPAQMLQFKEGGFAGFVTDLGTATSHTAIVARGMEIPAVVAARGVSQLVRPDDWVVLDGDAGVVVLDPTERMRAQYEAAGRDAAARDADLQQLRGVAARTRDGQAVQLLANIESAADVAAALRAGVDGVGLFRSEFLFIAGADRLPGEEEQYLAYRAVVEGMHGMPVTIRTVDIGADKPLDRARQGEAANPALGLRAIRWSLADPAMFRTQLRALLRAAAHGPVRVLFPMLAHLHEIRQALAQVALAQEELAERGVAAGPVSLGAMIEVPAAALMADEFLDHFNFLSIGTNDLIQYTLAIDRTDEAVGHLYDPAHPAVLRLLDRVIAAGRRRGKEISVCGEMASDPEFTRLLLGLGLRVFSMPAMHVLRVKQQVLAADAKALATWAQQVVASRAPRELLGMAAL
ncbi:MAG: phosphoenolpyruvate--protein phosphotransferase [Comamonadaceae bacterium]|nr:phosphoenolpyruvate--protein phosphotransferase [Burkholderiales bacterium]MEB2348590.1 phosphoenolpyruvate--protein phosphotransferase [Comamonadaceae bacterium]